MDTSYVQFMFCRFAHVRNKMEGRNNIWKKAWQFFPNKVINVNNINKTYRLPFLQPDQKSNENERGYPLFDESHDSKYFLCFCYSFYCL